MTEQEWIKCEDPGRMLAWLQRDPNRTLSGAIHDRADCLISVSDRRLCLFACACSRLAWSGLSKERRQSVLDAEEHPKRWLAATGSIQDDLPAWRYCMLMERAAREGIIHDHEVTKNKIVDEWLHYGKREQADLLREIVGNPFQPFPVLRRSGGSVGGQGLEDLDWQSSWLSSLVLALSRAAYDNPRPDGTLDLDRLAVLADALEESGCDEPSILGHLRARPNACPVSFPHLPHDYCDGTPAPRSWIGHYHYRGCWVLDLLLGEK